MVWWVKSSQSTGLDFRSESSIFTDTIHITHGTPEAFPGTHCILWRWVYRDRNKTRELSYKNGDYTRIPLLYTSESRDDRLWVSLDQSLSDTCRIVIDSILQAEERILWNVEK